MAEGKDSGFAKHVVRGTSATCISEDIQRNPEAPRDGRSQEREGSLLSLSQND